MDCTVILKDWLWKCFFFFLPFFPCKHINFNHYAVRTECLFLSSQAQFVLRCHWLCRWNRIVLCWRTMTAIQPNVSLACKLRLLSRTGNNIYYFYVCGQSILNLSLFLLSSLFVLYRKSSICYDSITLVHFFNPVNRYKVLITLFWYEDATMWQDIELSCHGGVILNKLTEVTWSKLIDMQANKTWNCKSV